MQTLRKKNSPCKYKNDPNRFHGEGVSFKAKLIGILEVSEARGDRMCQAALADLKMAIRAAGEHKQRIAVQVSIDGLRLKDEKTGDCLYHHPVHKISFIAQDMSDSRAFGYIFGSPDTGHRFFGIKTDKAASQVVIAMRDLFQVVFEQKKKEIEQAKQQIEQNAINAIKFHTGGIFVEPAPDTKGAAGTESSFHRIRTTNCEVDKPVDRKNESQSGVIADLLDLQFELNSLQQGIHQMDKITPENPVPSTDDLFETDPFGDSFVNMKLQETVRPILPPPPSSTKRGHLERQHTVPAPPASSTSSPATLVSKTPPPQSSIHWFDKEAENLFTDNELANLHKNATSKKDQEDSSVETTPRNTQTKSPQIDVFTELDPLGTGLIKPYVDKKDFFQHLKNPPKKVLKDLVSTSSSDSFPTNFNITTTDSMESTKVHSEMSSRDSEDSNFANFERFDENEEQGDSPPKKELSSRSIHHQPLSVSLPPEEATSSKGTTTASANATGGGSILRNMDRDSTESTQALVKLPSPKKYLQSVRKRDFDIDLPGGKAHPAEPNKQFPVDFSVTNESPASPLRSCSSDANSRLSSSSAELDLVPEPPPRGAGSVLINPPPLPPKKQGNRGGARPPPRPPHTDGHFQYDFPQRETPSSPTRITRDKNKSPPRDSRGHQFDDNFSPPPQLPARSDFVGTMSATSTAAFEDSFSTMMPPATSLSSTSFTSSTAVSAADTKKSTKPSLDITLSQLTSSWTNLDELASSLNMTVQQLTSMTLTQLTQCLATLSTRETASNDVQETVVSPVTTTTKEQVISPRTTIMASSTLSSSKPLETTIESSVTSFVRSESFKSNYEPAPKQDSTYDKYAVFRELLEMEQMERKEEMQMEETGEKEELDENGQSDGTEIESEVRVSESTSDSIASLVNLTVKLPVKDENLLREELARSNETTTTDTLASLTAEREKLAEVEDRESVEKDSEEVMVDADVTSDSSTVQQTEIDAEDDEKTQTIMEAEEKAENSEKGSDANGTSSDKVGSDILNEETNGSSAAERSSVEVKSSTSTSSDRYAALREIIGEPEPSPIRRDEDEMISPARASPVIQQQSQQNQQPKSLAEVELLNLFADNLPPPSSPSITIKKDADLKAVAMDIFEEIKMLNTGTHRAMEGKPPSSSGFEDMFCPFAETTRSDRDDSKEDGNWAKFETSIFGSSDRSSCEGQRSLGGTSPWSPDGKDIHREVPFKGSGGYRHSGDSDNEWKDEEESEESNGRVRGDGRYWSRHPRFDAPAFEDRSFYEEGDKRERSFRDRMGRKSGRGTPWGKSASSSGGGHRPRDPSPWHEEGQWEDEGPRRAYSHRKVPYKDEEDQYEAHWKCRPSKPPLSQRCNWSHDVHGGTYYDDERKRKLMLWSEEDRFGSQESMGYDEEDRWSRRRYERRRWEEDGRFWGRRGPPDADYPMREPYYYYRDRPHDYPSWDEEYGPEPRPADDSPRYNPAGRKRHWPKRPNSANDGRNPDVVYTDPRKFGGTTRSECSDNDSDPYLRPSQRSRSRESYWGSDQEYDSWAERPYWSEGPDAKSETLHRKRIARHKTRQVQKTQSPFEDDFAQSVEHAEPPSGSAAAQLESLASMDARIRSLDVADQKREPPPTSPSSGSRGSKDHLRRDVSGREFSKRSSYFEDDLTPTASASSDTSDRQRLSSELKATPEELPCDIKDPQQQSIDGFTAEDSGRDSFFNGDLRFDDDAFAFKSELDDNVPDHRATTLPLKNSRQGKYGPGNNNNNNKSRSDQYIRKSESVNIFARESDPFDGDDFFN
ncbi:protein disabled isoform X1 [Ooceraea biroi]|uniref:protein disabled isoform X1 n=1 Tax=Ooceraea biroi TaxID=2015173 RepID=UPI0005BD5E54|nr:protein disabled isoform X1 [Ooceraea biroi]